MRHWGIKDSNEAGFEAKQGRWVTMWCHFKLVRRPMNGMANFVAKTDVERHEPCIRFL